jgi:C4-dicarboxylate transporter, DctM subunit
MGSSTWYGATPPMRCATLLGESLLEGVDSFALIGIPLVVPTGDVMVRSGLADRLLDFAEAGLGHERSGFGTAPV